MDLYEEEKFKVKLHAVMICTCLLLFWNDSRHRRFFCLLK